MVAAKEWTKLDPKDAKIIALTTRLSKLEENQASVFATVQRVGSNRTQTRTNIDTKRRDPNKNYVDGLKDI